MKKKLLSIVLASCALVSMVQARTYVGIEGGYSATTAYDSGLKPNSFGFAVPATSVISNALKNGPRGFSVSGVFGSEDFYGKYFGTRWGVSAGYTQIIAREDASNKREVIDAGLSFDLMLNFINTGSFSFGIFGGVSGDYHYSLTKADEGFFSRHMFDFSGRAGVTTMLANHHRFEFFAKLPVASMHAASNEAKLGGVLGFARTTFGASYKFVF